MVESLVPTTMAPARGRAMKGGRMILPSAARLRELTSSVFWPCGTQGDVVAPLPTVQATS